MIGVSVPQLDIPFKVNGTAKYGIDTFLPGMVYGKLVLPPVRYGATVKSVDDSAAKKVPGFIKAVTLDDKTMTTTGWVVAVIGDPRSCGGGGNLNGVQVRVVARTTSTLGRTEEGVWLITAATCSRTRSRSSTPTAWLR